MFLEFKSLSDLVAAVRRRRISPNEVVAESLEAIGRDQPRLNAFITVMAESAQRHAKMQTARAKKGAPPGLLAGVPLAVKDLLVTIDAPTTAGSRIYGEGLSADVDAEVVARLRRHGAIVVGKTNLHEVALGVTTVNEHFGPARNPWNTDHVSGGSSGGSAVAVAADMVPVAIGTDTRGSIRIPASCCGITGHKPTNGLVSVQGVLALAYTLDSVGPMAASAADCALLLAAMLPTSARQRSMLAAPKHGTKRLTIGVSEFHLRDLDGRVAKVVEEAIKRLGKRVKAVKHINIPELQGIQEASGVIASAEAVAVHDENLRARGDKFGPLVKQRLTLGYQRTALEYLRALEKQAVAKAGFTRAFEEVDVLVGASLPHVPGRIDQHHVTINGKEANTVESSTRLNAAQNVAGIPGLSVPCGFAGGLPVGLQLIGPAMADATLLALGAAWQRETDWHLKRPPTA